MEVRNTAGTFEMSPGLAHALVEDSWPHRHGELHELEHAFGVLPLVEVRELVRSQDEDGVVETSRLERVDGACVRIELDIDARYTVERQPCKLEARLRGRVRPLVSRISDGEDKEPLEAELIDRSARKSDMPEVRGVEGATEDTERRYCHSNVSPSTSTSTPGLTPARRSASSSSAAGGGVPTTR